MHTKLFTLRSMRLTPHVTLALLSLLAVQGFTVFSQGTALTYQGRLNANGVPANGSYDMTFALFNGPTIGGLVAGPITNTTIAVNNGLFTTTLNFGGAPWNGQPIWLQIGVRSSGSGGAFIILGPPLQPITPAPSALFAANVANGAVDTPQLAGGAVTAGKIADGAVTSAKVADSTLQPADLNLGNFGTTFWKVGGNAGTTSDFIGTTDDQPFDVRVNNVRVMRYRMNSDPSGFNLNAPNVIGGSSLNGTVTTSVVGATIAGGGGTFTNIIFGGFVDNPNKVTGDFGTIGGGSGNTVSGPHGTVPGGGDNTAAGILSFAGGASASANHDGSFVWGDGTADTTSATANSVAMRASGGFRFFTGDTAVGARLAAGETSWSSISDRNVKKNFQPVDGEAVLEKLAALPVQSWNYKWEADTNTPHFGPMAQDFKVAFYPGRDDKSISTLEFDGVELAAIRGLNGRWKSN